MDDSTTTIPHTNGANDMLGMWRFAAAALEAIALPVPVAVLPLAAAAVAVTWPDPAVAVPLLAPPAF